MIPELRGSGPWRAALEEAWAAYGHGSVPIGACVADAGGAVLARGRNRLGEPRRVDGVIAGHQLGHAEVNTLLALPELSREQGSVLTLYTTVEPCPMCLGAMLMARLGRLAYGAADPWAGHAEALHSTFYLSQKQVLVSRAPAPVEAACTVLLLTSYLDGDLPRDHGFFLAHERQHPDLFALARQVGETRCLPALAARRAGLDEVLAVLA